MADLGGVDPREDLIGGVGQLGQPVGQRLGVLGEIGAAGIAQILVCNKLDALEPTQRPREASDVFEIQPGLSVPRVFISARTGEGLERLRELVADALERSLNDAGTAPYEAGSRARWTELAAEDTGAPPPLAPLPSIA